MNEYRLTIDDLYLVLNEWDLLLKTRLLLVACGGTALTLQGFKESTKDVDFILPHPKQHQTLINTLESAGYRRATGSGWKHPEKPFIFDLYVGQRIFTTDLLDALHTSDRHRPVRVLKHLTVAVINSLDLIISKMFRGDQVDVDDSILLLKQQEIDLNALFSRYKETAAFSTFGEKCKKNFAYLIAEMDRHDFDTAKVKEEMQQWTP